MFNGQENFTELENLVISAYKDLNPHELPLREKMEDFIQEYRGTEGFTERVQALLDRIEQGRCKSWPPYGGENNTII